MSKMKKAYMSLVRETVDVVGVVTPLRGVAQVVLHGVQVVKVGELLRVPQDRGVEEAREREEGEVKENHTCMKMG